MHSTQRVPIRCFSWYLAVQRNPSHVLSLLHCPQVLLRLSACGHKVLLFCTMTRCLDYMEEYLSWR